MFKTIKTAALLAAAAATAMAALPTAASAGEGHWSIGKGVQCHVVLGVVICSSNRP